MSVVPPPPPAWMRDKQEDDETRSVLMARRSRLAAALLSGPYAATSRAAGEVAALACNIDRAIEAATDDEIGRRRDAIRRNRAEEAKR